MGKFEKFHLRGEITRIFSAFEVISARAEKELTELKRENEKLKKRRNWDEAIFSHFQEKLKGKGICVEVDGEVMALHFKSEGEGHSNAFANL